MANERTFPAEAIVALGRYSNEARGTTHSAGCRVTAARSAPGMEQNIGLVEVKTVHTAEPLGEALTGLPRDNLLERPLHRRLEPACSEDGTGLLDERLIDLQGGLA